MMRQIRISHPPTTVKMEISISQHLEEIGMRRYFLYSAVILTTFLAGLLCAQIRFSSVKIIPSAPTIQQSLPAAVPVVQEARPCPSAIVQEVKPCKDKSRYHDEGI